SGLKRPACLWDASSYWRESAYLDRPLPGWSRLLACMKTPTAFEIAREWESYPRWRGIQRPYTAEDVVRLGGSIRVEHTLARMGSERLWTLLHEEPYIAALGALTGNQALQQVMAGLKAIYLSGW